ncbi:hypothetical protein GOP47_0005946 [Adiantum capillus-veneris]|uniref:ATP-dependent DNA helicase n=1 Tax=Adiantum capillus-veneris TaxID=13818 RepID=A0A9D4V2I9_ADICA|nr:hypothetical protein GOP47_0005946 [Adiantum capillus-veneris]
MLKLLQEFAETNNPVLTSQQQAIFDHISGLISGLRVITSVPGCGKTFLIKFFTSSFIKNNKTVILTASTGAVAASLSSLATTVHYQFRIPCSKQHFPQAVHPMDERFVAIHGANVIIIDEISMLVSTIFNMTVRQIVNISNETLLDPFSQKLILLFGDLVQLPPVYHHQEPLCHVCNIRNSAYIAAATTHNMTFSVRHAADPAYVQFLDTIRVK